MYLSQTAANWLIVASWRWRCSWATVWPLAVSWYSITRPSCWAGVAVKYPCLSSSLTALVIAGRVSSIKVANWLLLNGASLSSSNIRMWACVSLTANWPSSLSSSLRLAYWRTNSFNAVVRLTISVRGIDIRYSLLEIINQLTISKLPLDVNIPASVLPFLHMLIR